MTYPNDGSNYSITSTGPVHTQGEGIIWDGYTKG